MAIAEPLDPDNPAAPDTPVADVGSADNAALTASKARRSSFYLAMRVLPRAQRDAMYEIYSFCREVDDIADDAGDRDERRVALHRWRARIDRLFPGTTPNAPDGVSVAGCAPLPGLERAIQQFALQKDDFIAVIDGMQMDLDADIQAPTFEILDLYCDRVASAVGRLSTQVFGLPRDRGVALAHHLGRALQFTNILRDLDEDAEINRLYLPSDALAAAGIAARTPHAVLESPSLSQACAWLAGAARVHYVEADALMRSSARTTVRAPKLMSVVYREIFEKTTAQGWNAPRTRIKLSRSRLIWLLLRYGIF